MQCIATGTKTKGLGGLALTIPKNAFNHCCMKNASVHTYKIEKWEHTRYFLQACKGGFKQTSDLILSRLQTESFEIHDAL